MRLNTAIDRRRRRLLTPKGAKQRSPQSGRQGSKGTSTSGQGAGMSLVLAGAELAD